MVGASFGPQKLRSVSRGAYNYYGGAVITSSTVAIIIAIYTQCTPFIMVHCTVIVVWTASSERVLSDIVTWGTATSEMVLSQTVLSGTVLSEMVSSAIVTNETGEMDAQ